MVSLVAAVRVACRWLQIDPDDARVRAEMLPELDAVCITADSGRAALIGADLRPLIGEPGVGLRSLAADFAEGWRTDFAGRAA
jgi:hypothetical protein